MASAPATDLIPVINTVLNRVRQRMGITTDEALGTALGVSDVSIYLWRKGELGKSARVLLPLILDHYQIPPSPKPRKYRRRRRAVELV